MTAVITGGTRGLGRAIAEAYLAEGADLVCAARNPYDIDELVGLTPDRVSFHKTDVTDEDSVTRLMEHVTERYGRLDILVNNAGTSRDARISRLSLADWNTTISTNLTGVFLCTKAAIAPMAAQGGGRIINVSSCVAGRAAAGAAAYSASKAAVEMFTRTSAMELAAKGIAVNCLSPGYIDEGMGRELAANPKAWETYRGRLMAGRLGRPDEVGAAAVFLAGADSSYVNGHVMEVNGGLVWAA
ncbi:SDR family NAD(P)-dependent oxidoreductase [Streptacidiphilus sp. PAMC 29251]